jgi:hypothetical protein
MDGGADVLQYSRRMFRNRWRWGILGLTLAVLPISCGNDEGGQSSEQSKGRCEASRELTRREGRPFGVLLPSGRFEGQSYGSAQAIVDAGLNAASIGVPFYYTQSGDVVFGRRDESKEQWLDEIRCVVVEAKDAGLITLVWGQFVQADAPRGQEPMDAPASVQAKLGPAALELIPEVAQLLEELKVEYFSPVSELDKFVGFENHNLVFADMVAAARTTFKGKIYAQPNTLSRPPSFDSENIPPEFGGVDAMSIAWISFDCRADDMDRAQWYVDQAVGQGVQEFFIGEIGGVTGGSESDAECFETLITKWNGASQGVIVLDAPSDMPGAAQVAGTWRENRLRQLVGG